MVRKSIILTLLGILFFFNTAFSGDKYVIDPSHGYIGFAVRHMVINLVKGDFKVYTAAFTFDEQDVSRSSASAVIHVGSIDTRNKERDTHLRGPDFFDAKKYIENLNAKDFAGLRDWRLPTLEEAMSLMEPEKKNGDLYIDPVFNKKQQWIGTADTVKGEPRAWIVYFDGGYCYCSSYLYFTNYVRAVRSGLMFKR